jgi:hypothetical protein
VTRALDRPAYEELAAAWRALRPRDVRVREVACVGAPRTLLLAELGDAAAPAVSISAGVHGDEPAAWCATGCSTAASAIACGRV